MNHRLKLIFVAIVLVLSSVVLAGAQNLHLDDHSSIQVTCGSNSIFEYGYYNARDRDGEWIVMIVPPKVSTECLIVAAKLLHEYKPKLHFEFFDAKGRTLALYYSCYRARGTPAFLIQRSGSRNIGSPTLDLLVIRLATHVGAGEWSIEGTSRVRMVSRS
jgi:hypothetical protein